MRIWAAAGVAISHVFSAFGSAILEAANGVLVFVDNTGATFARICFGGTTNAFPSLKRTGAVIDARLADDSAFCKMRMASMRAASAVAGASAGEVEYGGTTATTVGAAGAAAALPATPVGYVIINVAGTNMKIPYYNT